MARGLALETYGVEGYRDGICARTCYCSPVSMDCNSGFEDLTYYYVVGRFIDKVAPSHKGITNVYLPVESPSSDTTAFTC